MHACAVYLQVLAKAERTWASENNSKQVMARKRQFHEIEDFNSVEQPIASAWHCDVAVSPLKKGAKNAYFDGTVRWNF